MSTLDPRALLALPQRKAVAAIRRFAARDPLGYLGFMLVLAEERARRDRLRSATK